MIRLDDHRIEPRLITKTESREYYDKIMDFLSETFKQERPALDSAMTHCMCFTKLVNLCLVAVDMDVPVDIISEANNREEPTKLKIVE